MGTNPETTTGTIVKITDVKKCHLYYLNEMPETDQKELTWCYDNPQDCGMQFFAYNGTWYDLDTFPTLSSMGADVSGTYYVDGDNHRTAIEWHAMTCETWCSGLVVNTDPVCFEDAVYVGYWTS